MDAYLSTVSAAQQKCWDHIEVATKMVENLEALKALRVASAIPILSATAPSLMITPEQPDDIVMIRALCRAIQTAMKTESDWEHIPMNNEWTLRLRMPSRITIDVMTHLPSVKEAPISL